MSTPQSPSEAGNERQLVEVLQRWHRAKEAANRYNRDVLQYGALIAGSAGMVVGAGGLTALANSAGGGVPWWAAAQLGVMVVAALVAIGGGVMLLLRTYRLREKSEAEEEQAMDRLIELRPDQFLPGPTIRRPG